MCFVCARACECVRHTWGKSQRGFFVFSPLFFFLPLTPQCSIPFSRRPSLHMCIKKYICTYVCAYTFRRISPAKDMPFDLVTANKNPFVSGWAGVKEEKYRISRSYTKQADEPYLSKEERFLGGDDGDRVFWFFNIRFP